MYAFFQDASKGPCLPRRFQLLLASAYEFLADSFFAEAGSLMAVDGIFSADGFQSAGSEWRSDAGYFQAS